MLKKFCADDKILSKKFILTDVVRIKRENQKISSELMREKQKLKIPKEKVDQREIFMLEEIK